MDKMDMEKKHLRFKTARTVYKLHRHQIRYIYISIPPPFSLLVVIKISYLYFEETLQKKSRHNSRYI